MRLLLSGALALSLSGCGVAYISPDVPQDDPNIQVIALTSDSIAAANNSSYRPKALPAIFFQNAGGGGALRGSGPAPAASLDAPQRPNALVTNIPPSAPPLPYEIGVGDVVLLATPSPGSTVEQLSGLLAAQNRRQGYTVQDDGAIAIPDVGRIELAGLTLEAAEAEVFQTLVENQIDPSFSIEVAEFNSKRVSIGGAVAKPAVVPITLASLTLEEALAATGGFATKDQEFASIRLYRDGTLYQVPLTEYFKRPAVQKTRLAAGDSIFVDVAYELDQAQAYFQEQITLAQFKQQGRIQALNELNAEVNLRRASLDEARSNFQVRLAADAVDRDYVYLAGEVANPSRFALPFAQQASLADALFSEGGFSTETGNPSQIYVLRGQGNGPRVSAYQLDAKNVANLVMATKLQLRPDDIIFISEQPITRWNRVVQQIVPSLITASVAAVQ